MRAFGAVLAGLSLVIFVAACGGGETAGGEEPSGAVEETTAEETTAGQALTPAEATVGPEEGSYMVPAGGEAPDPDRPPPENPPEGVETFPAATNNLVEGPIEYDRDPPTNGDHDPLWQNCGFYSEPIENRYAVHSLDHGVVWITYAPDLPAEGVEALRPYGREPYVVVSPYPDQEAPVIATSWRNQLRLDGADDPRLRQFVDQFRVTSTAPLSGNGCTGGVGEPET